VLKLLFLIFFIISTSLFAGDIEVSSFVDKATMTTGDLLKFTVKVKSGPNDKIKIPEIGDSIKGFRVVDFGIIEPVVIDGIKTIGRFYELQADIVGSYILPSVMVNYNDKEYKTSEIFIEVKSVLNSAKGGKDKSIRDIKTIIPKDQTFNKYILIGCGILFFVFLFLGYLWWRQKKSKSVTEKIIPPDVIALNELLKLEKLELLAKKEDKRFHFKLSEITRIYIEGRFGFRATDMTTHEIRKSINQLVELNDESKKSLLELLDD
jgi:hypothetical protein